MQSPTQSRVMRASGRQADAEILTPPPVAEGLVTVQLLVTPLNGPTFALAVRDGASAVELAMELSKRTHVPPPTFKLAFRGRYLVGSLDAPQRDEALRMVLRAPLRGGGCGPSTPVRGGSLAAGTASLKQQTDEKGVVLVLDSNSRQQPAAHSEHGTGGAPSAAPRCGASPSVQPPSSAGHDAQVATVPVAVTAADPDVTQFTAAAVPATGRHSIHRVTDIATDSTSDHPTSLSHLFVDCALSSHLESEHVGVDTTASETVAVGSAVVTVAGHEVAIVDGHAKLPEDLESVPEEAFYGCSSLISVTIPSSVTSIGDGAFRDCSSLSSVTIPSSVTSIGNRAFANCSSLSSVTIPFCKVGNGSFPDTTVVTDARGWGTYNLEAKRWM